MSRETELIRNLALSLERFSPESLLVREARKLLNRPKLEQPVRYFKHVNQNEYGLIPHKVRIERVPDQLVVGYLGEDATIWVRDREEFFDGRFKEIKDE